MSGWPERAYFAAPVWVQHLAVTAYGLKLRYLRSGRVRRAYAGWLRGTQRDPGSVIAQRQRETLAGVLRHARETVPYYRDLDLPTPRNEALDQLAAWPVTTKHDLQAAGRRVISERAAERRLTTVRTGGTTGTPLTVFCSRAVLQKNFAYLDRLVEWADVPPRGRRAVFAGRVLVRPGQTHPPYWRHHLTARTLLFSSYHIGLDSLPAYARALARFGPDLIDTYPSSLEPIARHLLEQPAVRVRPRAVITSSETLSPEARAVIERAFDCRVLDYYGGAEMAAFISQCEAGSYHVHPEFGIVELLRDGRPVGPGQPGEIVATGFLNDVMPLVRYATGDEAIWRDAPCPCGRAFPVIEALLGRSDDVVVTPDGRRVGRLDPIFKTILNVHETRIVQDERDHLRVEIVPRPGLAAEEVNSLVTELGHRVGPAMRIDVVRVGSIPRTRAGKLRTVVNEVAARSHPVPADG